MEILQDKRQLRRSISLPIDGKQSNSDINTVVAQVYILKEFEFSFLKIF